MPYKNIEDKRAAHKRWRQRHPDYWKRNKARKHTDEERYKNAARMQAYREHLEPQLCRWKGCCIIGERHHPSYANPKDIVWLCREHHIMMHQMGGGMIFVNK